VKKKKTKRTYRLRNWKQYNSALVQRGSLTLWVSDDILALWRNHEKSGERGKPRYYSDTAILCMATLQEVYHLPLRSTQGLMQSIVKLMSLDLTVPDYSLLCRRRKTIDVALPRRKKAGPMHMVVDSTGIKIFGEGEWKVRQHGYTKRRTWRKLHIGADVATGEIVAAVVTTNNFADSQVFELLLEQVEDDIDQVSGDGAYDKRSCYEAIREREAKATIPPRRDAKIWQHGNSKSEPTHVTITG
jgi:Transposase DDE domain